jgi:SAM-dependent methyltransferase
MDGIMKDDVREQILAANIALHRDEAELYDRIHPELTNAEELRRLHRLVDLAVRLLPHGAGRHALDLGAGTGLVTGELLSHGFETDAVDLSPEMLARLRAKFGNALQGGRLRAHVEDAETFLARAEKPYDLITASSVLHHFPDYVAVIRLMTERLVPGGTVIFFHEPTSAASHPIESLLRRVDWKLARAFLIAKEDLQKLRELKLSYEMADYHATHGFDDRQVLAALEASGCKLKLIERYAVAQTGMMRKIFSLFFKPTTWCLVAQKPMAP